MVSVEYAGVEHRGMRAKYPAALRARDFQPSVRFHALESKEFPR